MDHLKTAFLDHYLPDKAVIYNELRRRRQGPKQTIELFFTDMLQLCNAANPTMDEATKITMIQLALHPTYTQSLSLISLPKTLKDLKDTLLNIERSRFQMDSPLTTGIQSLSLTNSANNAPRSFKPKNPNFRNRPPGETSPHTYREPAPESKALIMKNQQRSCYICISPQHWTWDCPRYLQTKNRNPSENSKWASTRGPRNNQKFGQPQPQNRYNNRHNNQSNNQSNSRYNNRRPQRRNNQPNQVTQNISALGTETPTTTAPASQHASPPNPPIPTYSQILSA